MGEAGRSKGRRRTVGGQSPPLVESGVILNSGIRLERLECCERCYVIFGQMAGVRSVLFVSAGEL